jgi:ABC-2 type transport system ATP-binding protein
VCLQATNLPEKITVREALNLFGAFYSRTVDGDALLKRLTLWEKRDAFYGQLSGGQKQRVALALALLNDPQLLFLDEPSAGLDPQARLEIHELVSGLRKEQRSILLTTHYIEEAEKLCDRVAIVDEGRIVAIGSPHEIQARALGHSVIRISCEQPLPDGSSCPWRDAEKPVFSEDRLTLSLQTTHPARTLVDLVKWMEERSIELSDVHLKRPTLEDAFIELTGKSLRE